MTDSKPTANAGPPPKVDIQDPIPESNFFWRRVYSYLATVLLLGLLGLVVWRMESASELKAIGLYLCILIWFLATYYMIAPSAEQIVKMLKTADLFKHGVTVQQTATASSDQGQAATQTVVGVVDTPPVAPAPLPPLPEVTSDDEEDAAPRSNRT